MIEISGYTIKRELAAGDTSSVYLAVQTSLEREVALKTVAPTLSADAEYANRFLQVARALASFSHPNIVSVYDVGTGSGQLQYFSMQYLAGGNFTERVQRNMSEQELTDTLAGVARALGYVHQRGLIHRAIAPKNVMYDANGTPFLIDFGIAPTISQEAHITSAGFAIGTSQYMSPEQARGSELDARSDIYSLGALCYYGLVGHAPFDGADGFAVAYAHVFEPIPRLPASRAHWQPLIDGALAKDPRDRYAKVEEFLDALTSVALNQEGTSTRDAEVAAVKADAFKSEVMPDPIMPDPIMHVPVTVAANEPVAAIGTGGPTEPQVVVREATVPDVTLPDVTLPDVTAPSVPEVTQHAEAEVKMPPADHTVVRAAPATVGSPAARAAGNADAAATRVHNVVHKGAAQSNWARAWPIIVVVLGVALIGAALLLRQKKSPASVASAAPVVQPAATIPEPANAAAVPNVAPIVDAPPPVPSADSQTAPAITKNDTFTPADSSVAASAPVEAAPEPASVAPATTSEAAPTLGILDAAEAQAEGDSLDPTKWPTVIDPLVESIRLGRIDLAGQRLTTPPGKNALDRFQFALKLDAKNKSAKAGIVEIAKKYLELADSAQAVKPELPTYAQALDHANDIAKLVPEGGDVQKDILVRRHRTAEPLIASAKIAAAGWDKAKAKSDFERALQIDPDNSAAREGLKQVAAIGEAGFVFRDKAGSAQGPEMEILGGATIAMQRHAVTRAEFRRYWNEAGRADFGSREPSCRDRESIFRSSKKRNWENPDIAQEDNHPVVCISWPEAAAFAQWTAKQTGKHYRLPSSAEFDQVAARAGRGDCSSANLADASFNKKYDSRDGSACDDGFAATAPVGRFGAIEGIFDIDGNVREWVANCGNGAPAASATACRDFRVKGRGWLSASAKEPATFSDNYAGDVSLNSVGFRLVRDVEK